ncbi:hypothetical protein D9619_008187 [Psilocybe cf. subviscida]|uniref:Transmembrane protein n=1 Tax=Psilocybe cf. subviscida TaxID=2480587 RepID=A0A8H5ATY8_9AGAR|nr:hypothetical protein D9619_008187 [Psilocybe cf. subviscida]
MLAATMEDDDWDALASELVQQNYAFAAIVLKTSHSFAYRRLAPIYVFMFPVALLSIGTCQYILRIERDRYIRKTLIEVVDIDDLNIRMAGDKSKQRVVEDQLSAIPHSYPADLPLPMSDPESLSIRTSQSQTGGHHLDTVSTNFPYLYGAESYKLKRNRTSMATANTTNYSGSSLDVVSRPPSVGTLRGSSPRLNTGAAVDSAIANAWNQNNIVDETLSMSDIEIGSLHSSSSVDSEELRQFYGNAWNAGPFMAAGP